MSFFVYLIPLALYPLAIYLFIQGKTFWAVPVLFAAVLSTLPLVLISLVN